MNYRALIAAASLTILNLWGASAWAFRCNGDLVDTGESKAEVLVACGEPAWQTRWTEEVIEHAGTVDAIRFTVDKEQWLYNLGPTQFLRMLVFENGHLAEVRTGERGGVEERKGR